MHYLSTSHVRISTSSALETSNNLLETATKLARRCSLPAPPGDPVKVAVGRASDRTGIPYGRIREIWYGNARRIEAWEMDRLREGANAAEIDIAIAGINEARRRLEEMDSPSARVAVGSLDRAARLLGRGDDKPRRRSADRR